MVGVAVIVSGCGVLSGPTPTSTPVPTKPIPTPPVAHVTPTPSRPQPLHIALPPSYRSFIDRMCHAVRTRNATPLINSLEYYQYNSDIYYGTFDRSEGQHAAPTELQTWLNGGSERCVRFGPALHGHADLVTKGWSFDGGWCILDLDKLGGVWKINDFTFGRRGQVLYALYSNNPEDIPYNGRA